MHLKIRLFLSLIVTFFLFLLAQSTKASNGVNNANIVSKGVVCIDVITKDGTSIVGSGFYVAPSWVASSAHQLKNADTIKVLDKDGNIFDADSIATNEEEDLALIKMPFNNNFFLPLVEENKIPKLGQPVFTIGCPYGLEHSLSRGVISHEGRDINNKRMIQTDVQVGFGSSGGPLFNENGDVVGVFHGVLEESKSISFVVPSNRLKMLMQKANISVPSNSKNQIAEIWDNAQKSDNLNERIELYNKLVTIAPWLVEAHYNLGIANYEKQNWADAESNLLKAIELKPDYYNAYVNLGLTLKKNKKVLEAKDFLLKAIEIDATKSLAYFNLGLIYMNDIKDNDLASKAFLKFIEISPNAAEVSAIKNWLDEVNNSIN